MKSNFSNQNHGSRAFRNASITFYHNWTAFDTSSSQGFVQRHIAMPALAGQFVIFLGRIATPARCQGHSVTEEASYDVTRRGLIPD
jgi:hypothetical protein